MIEANDIRHRIETDFGAEAPEAYKILEGAVLKTDYLNSNRVIRCILFLAEGNIEKLQHYIEAAKTDPRDVMLWAEYTEDIRKKVINFSKEFDSEE